ncbi:hypothetical protein [Nocardia sp. XZ_19_385]|uniref:hypothetical protein n=1 Tax=Nocardia sp. XZ_19_385 TaxID=2769488 RepID=UPI0018909724|nr:hypothetical protein [Nocardia sp. XZ_19_385]
MAAEIGYFLAPGLPGTPGIEEVPTLRQLIGLTTPGTRASLTGGVAEASFAFRRDPSDLFGVRRAAGGERLLRFGIAGTERTALTIGASEHFGLPEVHEHLERVDVGLGWFGTATPMIQRLTSLGSRVLRSSATGSATQRLAERLPWQMALPSLPGRTLVAARALDRDGVSLALSGLEGPEPYEFTARLLATTATAFAADRPDPTGVRGPLSAVGAAALREYTEAAGLRSACLNPLSPTGPGESAR